MKLKQELLSEEMIFLVSDIFKALSDPTRIRMLYELCIGECSVGELAEKLKMNQSAVSHQLRLLKSLRIVKFRREGTTLYYCCDDEHVRKLLMQTIEHVMH